MRRARTREQQGPVDASAATGPQRSSLDWGRLPNPNDDPRGVIDALSHGEVMAGQTVDADRLITAAEAGIDAVEGILAPARAAGIVSFATLERARERTRANFSSMPATSKLARFVYADYMAYLYSRAKDAYLDGEEPKPQYRVLARARRSVSEALDDAGDAVGSAGKWVLVGGLALGGLFILTRR